ncbi:MAG: CPBP family glutamic-type intramembrane protease [Brevirhabdus sp.]
MSGNRRWLLLEFVTFFVLAPAGMAIFLPAGWMFPALFSFTALGLLLLHVTPGFAWSRLSRGWRTVNWARVGVVALATFVTALAVMLMTRPDGLFILLRDRPHIMLMIAFFYPLVSALPQELVYRPLFFERYGPILPRRLPRAIWLNAVLFSFAHLMYWSWIVAVITLFGGLLFAAVYKKYGNFPEAVILHSLAGIILFAMGMGAYFYSGNVVRPF